MSSGQESRWLPARALARSVPARSASRARPSPSSDTHIEEGSYWADVPELPGYFASGDTLDELFESMQEGVALYLADKGEHGGPLHVATATLTDRPLTAA